MGCSWAGERYVEGTAGGRGRVTPWICLAYDSEKAIYKCNDEYFFTWGQGGMIERSRDGAGDKEGEEFCPTIVW